MKIGARELLMAWGRLLRGGSPLLSIEVTRQCPLHCRGCYAHVEGHAGSSGAVAELHGEALVARVLALVARHRPQHVSIVGGEPLLRRRELDALLPRLAALGVPTMVVTSGVLPIPMEWDSLGRLVVTVSVDGLAPDHARRRAPATYERILRNIEGRRVSLHWTVVHGMLSRAYFEEYLAFWSARPEVQHVLVSAYTPQRGERTPEMLTPEDRLTLASLLPALKVRYPKLLTSNEIARAYLHPPRDPAHCLFARVSRAYAPDLATEVVPCLIGGNPDCTQCGCAVPAALHGIAATRIKGPLRVGHLIAATTSIAAAVNRVNRPVPKA